MIIHKQAQAEICRTFLIWICKILQYLTVTINQEYTLIDSLNKILQLIKIIV